MKESLSNAKDELKRADHSIFVSLKYTRTVDMMKHIIERFVNASAFVIDALLIYAKKKKKIKEIPATPVAKSETLKKIFSKEDRLIEFLNFSDFLRKLNRAEYTTAREFRRHVTMTAVVDEQFINVKIDDINEYFEKLKDIVEYVDFFIGDTKE